jgi:hypothetical protein
MDVIIMAGFSMEGHRVNQGPGLFARNLPALATPNLTAIGNP